MSKYATYPFPPDVFEKAAVVKDGCLEFTHNGKSFRLTCDEIKPLEGKAVLINSGMEAHRSGVNLGTAVPA